MKSSVVLVSSLAFLLVLGPKITDAAPADNSINNSVDRSPGAITPESQSNEQKDLDITRAIRRAVVRETSLSIYAQNIKIITTKNHVVYLRGVVSCADELKKVAGLAEKNAAGYEIKNELSVVSK